MEAKSEVNVDRCKFVKVVNFKYLVVIIVVIINNKDPRCTEDDQNVYVAYLA